MNDMSFFVTNLLVGIGLSMDAFSLAILYGTINLRRKTIWQLSTIVGIYHFFMPLLGYLIGDHFLARYILDPEFLVGAIFLVIAIQMLLSLKKEEEVKPLQSIGSLLLFGFTVSIDSFSIGIGFGTLGQSIISILSSCIVYSLTSATFTYFGLTIGTSLSHRFGKWSTFIGSIILLGLSIHYFLI